MKKALNSVINVDAAINLGLIFRQKATDYKNLLPPSPFLPSIPSAQSPATRSRFLWRVARGDVVGDRERGRNFGQGHASIREWLRVAVFDT